MGEIILLVDPAVSFTQFVTLVLTRLGHHDIAQAPNAESAMTMMTTWLPQLVFSETKLPGMNGLDFCAALRKKAAARFVFLTTDGSLATREAAAAAGASDFLTKPVSSRTLHDVAERHLPFHSQRRHLRTAMTLEAAVRHGDRDVTLRTLTVGEGGLFLVTPQPASVGTELQIRLPLPGLGGPIHLAGEVVHTSVGTGAEPCGMGVRFVGVDENTRLFMRHYLETYLSDGAPLSPM